MAEKADPAGSLIERLDFPLYVVTAQSGVERDGCLAGFVTQCSIRPVRFIVNISTLNRSYRIARRAGTLAVHLLGEQDRDLASLFGEMTGDEVDKLAMCGWRPGPGGAPVLERCSAWVEGPVLDRFEVGDHVAFLIAPAWGARGSGAAPLMYKSSGGLVPGHPVT